MASEEEEIDLNKEKLIFALIPARSGSKGIKDKNIIDFKGKPLFTHSIIQGLKSPYIDEVYVSTDSEKYAEIARNYGAKVPFLRPKKISENDSTDFEVFDHFISFLFNNEYKIPDILVHLRPTYPTRKMNDLDEAIQFFLKYFDEADSLRSVIKAPQTPYKMWKKEGKYLRPLLHLPDTKEPYNLPRQKLPNFYFQNACIDMMKT
ncbi:unnamed protein product, partial [marine sediment metagenome]